MQKKYNKLTVVFLLLILVSLFQLIACGTKRKQKLSNSNLKSAEFLKGEQIAKVHCSSCHVYVPPEMLDRISWPRVLSVMAIEMAKKNYVIKQEEWIKVQQFYLNQSPKFFFSSTLKELPTPQKLFVGKAITTPLYSQNAATLIRYLPQDSTLYLGKKNGELFRFVSDTLQLYVKLSNVPVDLKMQEQALYILGIGSLAPSEDRTGQLIKMTSDRSTQVIVDSLKRPVHFQITDLEKDGITDYLIASFGSTIGDVASGNLSHYSRPKQVDLIEDLPGAIQVEIADLSGDGREEIIALFSQGNESIYSYTLQANRTYTKQKLLEFSPVHGTNSFKLIDINQDGYLDLLVTNGDNDDYSQVYKSYHGLRIFINNQQNAFEEKYFYPINGAASVKTADMDQDGDMDVVVLAMYPDLFSRPWETVLYFENKGNLNFSVQYFEKNPSANWMLLEVADIDQDGDMDIITAANRDIGGLIPPALNEQWRIAPLDLKIYYNRVKTDKTNWKKEVPR